MTPIDLLADAQSCLESLICSLIECSAWLKEDEVHEGWEPVITDEIRTDFQREIALIRDIRKFLQTPASPDPDWFDRLIEGEAS